MHRQMIHHGICGMVHVDLELSEHSVSEHYSNNAMFMRSNLRYLSISLFIILVCILFGFWNLALGFSIMGGISGILQVLLGIIVMAIEAPMCCMFLDFAQQVAKTIESRPHWNRAAAYCG